jgi:predicted double-glycine peptidase
MRVDAGTPARAVPLALSLLAAVGTSCAQVGAAPTPGVRSLAESRHAGVVMQQWDLSCGAAAIATLLTHDLGHPVSERAAAEAMLGRTDPLKVRVQGGFSLLDLQKFAEARGYEASGYGNLSVGDLLSMAPAIVPVTFHGFDHFVVVRGARGGKVILADPAFGRRSVGMREFERAWNRKVAFVIDGPLEQARFPPASDPFDASAARLPRDASDPFDAPAASPPPDANKSVEGAGGTVESDATTRALERVLVRRGAIVLPPRQAEIEPEVGYVYGEADARRRDTVTPTLNLRLGLPWRAQVDVRVPFVAIVRQDGVGTSSGLGDVELGVTKHLLHERGAAPEMLVTARWKTASGSSDGRLPTGTGAHGVHAVLTALKRDPPVVLMGSVYYLLNLPSGRVDRGDAAGAIATALLAATPDVSLLVGLDVATFSATTVGGDRLPRSDRLSAIVNVGAARVLTRRLGASLTAGFGVTSAAPPLLLSLSLPFRP